MRLSSWRFFGGSALVLLACVACASRAPTVLPSSVMVAGSTASAVPTATFVPALPSASPAPSASAKPAATAPPCIPSTTAAQRIGETACVRGTVARTYSTARAFFIEFDAPGKGFFGVSLASRWEIPQGACVQVAGTLLNWQGRPYMVLDADVVRFCDSAILPYRVAFNSITATPQRLAPTAQPTSAHFAQTVEAQVVRVIDGDTIDVRIGGQIYRVRYIGVDTPETMHPTLPVQCMGREASAFNRQLVDGKTVRLEKDISETDRYGRLLRYVYVGDLFVNAELVRQGFAQVATYPPDVKYQNLFLQLQREAREAGRGLWSACELYAAPTATVSAPAGGNCDPSYPDVCIPPPPPDLDCSDIPYRRFRVVGADPHRFDGDRDGMGCER